GLLAMIRRLTARENADELRARIMRHLEHEADPELSDIRIVGRPADLDPRMPRYTVAFLEHVWRR
ncbi:MAG TPA: NUDIX hydrolase, partial [Xanthobacteraceae bacterium]